MVAAVAASVVFSPLCPGIALTTAENLAFMMRVHGVTNDAQFQEEVKAKGVDQITKISEHPELKEGACLYANLVNTYASGIHESAEKFLQESGH
jgi:hypothetical protein